MVRTLFPAHVVDRQAAQFLKHDGYQSLFRALVSLLGALEQSCDVPLWHVVLIPSRRWLTQRDNRGPGFLTLELYSAEIRMKTGHEIPTEIRGRASAFANL